MVENLLLGKVASADTLGVQNIDEIAVSHTIPEINVFLCFMQKFNMATKNSGKFILGNSHQLILWIPWGSNILTKSL